MKEQANISSTRNGDVNPITKLEQAQVHYINYNSPSDDIEDKTAHNNSNHSSDNYHGNCNSSNSSNCNCNFGPGNDPKLVYDPGGYTLKSKDDSMHDNSTDTTNSSSNMSHATDTGIHYSLDHDRDKTLFTASDTDADPPIDFMQDTGRVPDVTSLHPTDNLPTLLHRDSKGTDTVQRSLSPQHLALPLNFDHI